MSPFEGAPAAAIEVTIQTALLQGTQLLEQDSIPAPRLTAEVLLAHALRRDRSYLYAHPEEELDRIAWIHYGRYLHERLNGKPTQYITRRQEFYGREFSVNPDVLIPRPETEHLVEASLKRIRPGDRVADAGTGSGAIAITLALETEAQVFATDISIPALRVASANATRLKASVAFVACDLVTPMAARVVDVLISNPPYVPLADRASLQREVRDYEPHVALFGGSTGLDVYQCLIAEAGRVLRPNGWMLVELGYNSVGPVREMLGANWREVELLSDLAGLPRVLEARWLP